MLLREQLLWFLVLVTVLWGAIMSIEMSGYVIQPGVFGSSALSQDGCRPSSRGVMGDLELARTTKCFSDLIAPYGDESKLIGADRCGNAQIAILNTRLDFIFIALYWLTFIAFAWYYWPSQLENGTGFQRFSKPLALLIAVVITITAIWDIRENLRLFDALAAVKQGRLNFRLSSGVSEVKWVLLGVASLLLGLFPLCEASRLKKFLGLVLMLAGVVIDLEVIQYLSPVWGMLSLSIALLIGLVAYFPWRIPADTLISWLIYAYLLRFQILSGVILSIGIPLGYFLVPSIFLGLFDALARFSFFLMCFAALLLAMIIMITSRLTLAYAPTRFPDLAEGLPWMRSSWRPTILFSFLAAPLIALTCWGSYVPAFHWWQKLGLILLAVLGALLFLVVTAEFHGYLEDPTGAGTVCFLYPPFRTLRPHGGKPMALFGALAIGAEQILPQKLRDGILREQTIDGNRIQVLRSGHRLAATAFAATLILYIAIGILTAPRWWEHAPAAMFYVLFLLSLLTWFLTGAAFFLDRMRVPVLTTLVALSMLVSLGGGTDHVYELSARKPVELLGPSCVIERRAERRDDPTTPLVVIATAGGGIRASAWTAEVLTRLAEGCSVDGKNNFTSSVALISSVSEGSEGAMYFAGWYDREGKTDPKYAQTVRDESGQSDLGAVGWGLLYPDLLRTIPGSTLPILFKLQSQQQIDRGWALEKAWNQHWVGQKNSPMLSQWIEDTGNGTRPAVIFNATVAESGERFIASTTDLANQESDRSLGTVQFFDLYEGEDLPVSTAARLSATFPFVSPMTRADKDPRHGQLHVGDGGYYDNSGLLSATEWLRNANEMLKTFPVILIVIDSKPGYGALGQDWTWQRQALAPINTLLKVRTSSQVLRAHYEQALLKDFLSSELGPNPVPVSPIYFDYLEDQKTPLSWHLRADQKDEIARQWRLPDNVSRAKAVYDALHCPGPAQARRVAK